jgi:RNA polymerase sigma-70 factor (ECF subfamily)
LLASIGPPKSLVFAIVSRVSDASDIDLLNAWRQGDSKAGEELFERHYASISRFYRNKVSRGVDDLIQDTFLSLVETKDRFRGESSFRTYLFGVAHNMLRYHYRKQKRHADRIDFEHTSAADLSPGPGTIATEKSEQQLMLQALRSIPLDHQIVLELYYWEPMSATEIAEVLGQPEGTVRTRIRRAKKLLEEQLAVFAASPDLLERTVSSLESWAKSLRAKAGSAQ